MSKKKLTAALLALLLLLVLMTGCSNTTPKQMPTDNPVTDTEDARQTPDQEMLDDQSPDDEDEGEYGEEEAPLEEPGVYIEPITGARISFPIELTGFYESYAQYGGYIAFVDGYGADGSVKIEVSVDMVYAERMDDAYETLGMADKFDPVRVTAMGGNYLATYHSNESSFDNSITHVYRWLYLLSDGSMLKVSLDTARDDHAQLAAQVQVDFTQAQGELGLAAVADIPPYTGDSLAAGVWRQTDGKYWLDCPGGLAFVLYDSDGNAVDGGFFDNMWDQFSSDTANYSVYEESGTITLDGIDGEFVHSDVQALPWNNTPQGIPAEGVLGTGVSGPAGAFLGRWLHESVTGSLNIGRGNFNQNYVDTYWFTNYRLVEDGTLELPDGWHVRLSEDGGLTVDGYEGTFYPEGTMDSPFAPYVGEWTNGAEQATYNLQEDGGCTYTHPGMVAGFSGWSVVGENALLIANAQAYLDADGNLVIEGYDGVFERTE